MNENGKENLLVTTAGFSIDLNVYGVHAFQDAVAAEIEVPSLDSPLYGKKYYIVELMFKSPYSWNKVTGSCNPRVMVGIFPSITIANEIAAAATEAVVAAQQLLTD
jgi:hypothetical protein